MAVWQKSADNVMPWEAAVGTTMTIADMAAIPIAKSTSFDCARYRGRQGIPGQGFLYG